MADNVFGNLDREATEQAFKNYLKEWKDWKLKAMQRFPTIGSPSMDGQPHGSSYEPDKQFINYSEASFQYHIRIKCCEVLKSVGEEEEVLGDILLCRFIKGWSVTKTIMYINDTYNAYLDERTFRRKQEQALWEGALMCPDPSVRVPR